MVVTLKYDPAALIGASPESITHALAPSPWCQWTNSVEEDEVTTENYLAGIIAPERELLSLPPALIAIAASDMTDDQKHFFVGQSVGEMIIEHDRYLGADGAAQLGKILAVRPLMKPSDFVALLAKATEIQERDLRFGQPAESGSSPLALIASWCTTALAQPAHLSLKPATWTRRHASLEKVALHMSIFPSSAACTFSQVLAAILSAMPSEVEAELNENCAEEPAEGGATHTVNVPRGTREQYDILAQWVHAAMLTVHSELDHALEQANGSASTEANEVALEWLTLTQAGDLTTQLAEALQQEKEELPAATA